MKKKSILYLILLIIFSFIVSFLALNNSTVLALNLKDSGTQLGAASKQAGYGENPVEIEYIIAQIIKVILSFLGILFLILTIYGGFTWMTAHGNEEKVAKARKLITEAAIGLVIVLTSYIITFYVIAKIISAVFNIEI